jgi:hypothetical protein
MNENAMNINGPGHGNGAPMNLNDVSLHSRMTNILRRIRNYDHNGNQDQNMRIQLLNELGGILPEFNNLEEINAGHNGNMDKYHYLDIWMMDLGVYLERYDHNPNAMEASIVNDALQAIRPYMPPIPQGIAVGPVGPVVFLGGRRRRRSRKTRKSRKSRKGRKGRSRRN